jgi:hypothetical protein
MLRHSLCFAPLLLLAAGCDTTGEYDKKIQESVQASAKNAVFADNLHAAHTEVMDAAKQPIGVKLRLPKIFDNSSKVTTKSPIELPNVQSSTYGLMRVVDDPAGKKHSFSVIITATARPEQKAAGAPDLTKAFAAFFPGAKPEDVTFNSPTGQPVTFKRFRGDMQMPAGMPKMDGVNNDLRMDVYQIDAGGHTVMIMWMTPKAMVATLDPLQEASMGTLENAAAAPPPGGKAG